MTKKGQVALVGFILLLVTLFVFLLGVNPVLQTFANAGVAEATDGTTKLLIGSGSFVFLLLIIGLSLKAIRQGQIL